MKYTLKKTGPEGHATLTFDKRKALDSELKKCVKADAGAGSGYSAFGGFGVAIGKNKEPPVLVNSMTVTKVRRAIDAAEAEGDEVNVVLVPRIAGG